MRGARSVWLLAAPLMAASAVVAHALAYRLAGGDGGTVGRDDTHGYLDHLPVLAAPAVAAALVALALRAARTRRREHAGPLPWAPFALSPAAGFAVQEQLEGVLHPGAAPLAEPTFALGLALALPLGLAAFVVARALLGSADRAARVVAARAAVLLPPPTALRTAALPSGQRPRALAVARPTGRAPPPLAAT